MEAEGALAGIRVLECGDFVAAPYAAKLLAQLGADVVKIEPPQGDTARRRPPFPRGEAHPERSGLHLYLNRAKRSVVIDFSKREDLTRLRELANKADAVIVSGSPRSIEERGLTFEALRDSNARLVVTAITPFGMTGPRREWAATEIVEVAAGGWLYISPGALRDPSLPPLKAFGQQADYQGGVHGAIATLAGLFDREQTGTGQQIDVSIQAAIASNLEMNFMHWTYSGRVASRLGQRAIGPWGIIELSDGPFFLVCVEEDQWKRLADYLGRPEWTEWEIFGDRIQRGQNADALMPLIESALSHLTCERAYVELQERRVPCSPIFDMEKLLASDHLAARKFFVEMEHPEVGRLIQPGAPIRFSRAPWRPGRPAPRLGEHREEVIREWGAVRVEDGTRAAEPQAGTRKAPLAGVRVADFCWAWAGPSATLQLAHLGAEVVRVEAPGRGDITRLIPPFADNQPGPNRAGYFNQYNQGKLSVGLNLKHPDGLRLAKELIARSDIVTENFSAGVMDRLGLGYEELRKIKSDIVMVSFSGYGATGPKRSFIAYGPVQVAMIGLASLSGYPGMGPSEVGISYGDPNAGMHAAYASLVALWHQRRTGEGQFVDMSQWEAAIGLMSEAFIDYAMNRSQPPRMGNHDLCEAPQGVFRCAGDDEWVAIACWNDEQWRALAAAIGGEDLAKDEALRTAAGRKRHEERLEAAIAKWTATRDPEEVSRVLQSNGVPSYAALSNRGVAEDEQMNAWGAFVELPHPEAGVRRHIGPPWRFGDADVRVRRAAPVLGGDTERVLQEILGLDATEVRRLRDAGAVG